MSTGFHLLRRPSVAIALSLGLGLVPWMPGTFGAAGAFILYPIIMNLPWLVQCAIAGALFVLGCRVCTLAADHLGKEDPSEIVWDETVGMLIVLVLIPAGWLSWCIGFIAFRVFDINKPWLIGIADRRMTGGSAIMTDDALAGLAAAGTVWIITAAVQAAFTG